MGPVFAGRMILEVFLHSLKRAGVGGNVAPPFASRLPASGVEKVHMASVFASPGVGGKAVPTFANRLPARWYLNTGSQQAQALNKTSMETKAGSHLSDGPNSQAKMVPQPPNIKA